MVITDKATIHKSRNTTHNVTGLASHRVDQSKASNDQISMYSLPKFKVSEHKNVIECTNRFHILQECDVVSEYPCDAPNTIHAHTDITPTADPHQGYKHLEASQNDTFTTSNPTTALKGKQMIKSTNVEAKRQGCPHTQAYRPKTKVVTNNSVDMTGTHVNLDFKDESINGTKYHLDLRHNPKRSYKNFLPTCQTLQVGSQH